MTDDASAHTPIESPSVWHRADLDDDARWSIDLDEGQRRDLAGIGRAAHADGHTPATLTLDDVTLPSLAPTITRVVQDLSNGRGFVRLRGFPIDLLDSEEAELAYVALGLHLGTPVGQDAYGTLLGHIRDERIERTGPEIRLYRTRERQDFHTDGADIIGLLCLHGARSGGESKLVSSHAVHNEILRRRPDLLDIMYQPMWWDRNDEQGPGEDPAFELPILSIVEGTPRFFFIGWYIRDAQRHAQVPRLTEDQLAALDLIETIANDPAFHLQMDFRPGDVQLLNNAVILHAREAYEDEVDPDHRRHLLRLWLSAHDFRSVEDMIRGGIPASR